VLLRKMPLSPEKFVVVTVRVAARTPATMPTSPATISVSAGTFFVVRRLSFTRMLLILQSLRKMWQHYRTISHTFLAWTLHSNRICLPIGLVVSVLVPIALRSVSLPLPLLEQPVDCWLLLSSSVHPVQGRKVRAPAGSYFRLPE